MVAIAEERPLVAMLIDKYIDAGPWLLWRRTLKYLPFMRPLTLSSRRGRSSVSTASYFRSSKQFSPSTITLNPCLPSIYTTLLGVFPQLLLFSLCPLDVKFQQFSSYLNHKSPSCFHFPSNFHIA